MHILQKPKEAFPTGDHTPKNIPTVVLAGTMRTEPKPIISSRAYRCEKATLEPAKVMAANRLE